MDIKRAAVIGAGVMGSGIAAHLANAGIPVMLLDIVAKDNPDRSAIAKGAVEKMLKADPAPFMTKKAASLVTPGNLEDDLAALKDVDWVIEAVIECLDIKQSLYEKLEAVCQPSCIISSNTSTIPLQDLVAGRGDNFAQHFLITHFFNPPRYMRLLEVVAGAKTLPDVLHTIEQVGDVRLGKGVVHCHDRPGFIANRIGTYWIQVALNEAISRKLSVEEADVMMARPLGFPKTGVFGLMDLVGLDLMPHIAKSLMGSLPKEDAFCQAYVLPPVMEKMIADGYTGRKGKGGFYRLNTAGGAKVKEAVNLHDGSYAKAGKPKFASAEAGKGGLKAVLLHADEGGQYARAVMLRVFSYVAGLVPEIAGDIESVDRAMRLGYNWKQGPFEMMDNLGVDVLIAELEKDGLPVSTLLQQAKGKSFYQLAGGQLSQLGVDGAYHPITRPEGVLLLADIKRNSAPVAKNASASLWDIGDGVLCAEFHSKMNAIDTDIFGLLQKAIALIGTGSGQYKALVIHNEADNFSVGANLGLAIFALNIGLYPQIEQLVEMGQQTYKMLKFASFPTVAAPSGMALGGGCEVLLHCSHVQAHAETYPGLVEVGVGLIPGWGGCKEMLLRHTPEKPKAGQGGPMPALGKVFEILGTAKVGKSAFEAQELGYFRPTDGVTMNKDRLLFDAKKKALDLLAAGYKAPEPRTLKVAGPSGRAALDMAVQGLREQGKATPYDLVVSDYLAETLSGGSADPLDEVSEDDILKLERSNFMKLVRHEGTLKRIEHMLLNGKPLRN